MIVQVTATMTRNIMTRMNRATQLLACATLLAVMTGALPVSAQTMEEARTAFRRGDHARALNGFRNLAAWGDAQSQLILGGMYAKGEGVPEEDTEAVRWYRLAAEQGDVSAQLSLGFKYDKGEGVAKDDAEAMRWFCLAAEQGHPDSADAPHQRLRYRVDATPIDGAARATTGRHTSPSRAIA